MRSGQVERPAGTQDPTRATKERVSVGDVLDHLDSAHGVEARFHILHHLEMDLEPFATH
jgi:hypothetical protein